MAAARPAKQTLTSLLKRGWNEVPDIVAGTAVAIVGLGLGLIGLTTYYGKDGDNRKYKLTYVVMRPDDPRASRVHKD